MSDDEHFEDAVEGLTENLNSQSILSKDDACTDEAPDDSASDTNENSADTDNYARSNDSDNVAESEGKIDEAVLKEQEALMTEEEKQVCCN
jgi:hypothetical protein